MACFAFVLAVIVRWLSLLGGELSVLLLAVHDSLLVFFLLRIIADSELLCGVVWAAKNYNNSNLSSQSIWNGRLEVWSFIFVCDSLCAGWSLYLSFFLLHLENEPTDQQATHNREATSSVFSAFRSTCVTLIALLLLGLFSHSQTHDEWMRYIRVYGREVSRTQRNHSKIYGTLALY